MTVFISQYETLGANFANSNGITVTSNAAVNTKGAWTSFGLTGFDWTAFTVSSPRSTTAATAVLVDIAVGDGAGNFSQFLIQNILFGSLGNRNASVRFNVPMFVPTGTEILLRMQAAIGASVTTNFIILGKNELYSPRCYLACDTYGADTGITGGAIENAGAVVNTKGAWATIGVATRDYDCVSLDIMNIGFPSVPSGSDQLIDFGFGPAGAPTTIIPNFDAAAQSQPGNDRKNHGPFYLKIAPGDAIQARGQCSIPTVGSRENYVVAHCFYSPIVGSGGNFARRGLVRA